jgi:hypothetical protein
MTTGIQQALGAALVRESSTTSIAADLAIARDYKAYLAND